MPTSGYIISFEGGEGAGKTTQVQLLADYFTQLNRPAVVVKIPGTTLIGQQVRAILLNPENGRIAPLTEVFLHAAVFRQCYEEVLLSALALGYVVIADRFTDSALVYQGVVRGATTDTVTKVVLEMALNYVKPTLTILLDMPAELVSVRTCADRPESESRVDREGLEFHENIRQAFIDQAQREPNRIKVIDARQSIARVSAEVIKCVKQHMPTDTTL